jgi:hypothetical protein
VFDEAGAGCWLTSVARDASKDGAEIAKSPRIQGKESRLVSDLERAFAFALARSTRAVSRPPGTRLAVL